MRAILNNGPQAGRVLEGLEKMPDGRPPQHLVVPMKRTGIEHRYAYDEDMTLVHGWHRYAFEVSLRPVLIYTFAGGPPR